MVSQERPQILPQDFISHTNWHKNKNWRKQPLHSDVNILFTVVLLYTVTKHEEGVYSMSFRKLYKTRGHLWVVSSICTFVARY